MPSWGWLSSPGVPIPSEAICTLNHHIRTLSSRRAGTTRSGPTSALHRTFLGAIQPGLEKLGGRFPRAETPTKAQCLGLCGKGTCASAPSRILVGAERKGGNGGAGKIPGAQERSGRQEVSALPVLSGGQEPQRG